MTESLFSNNTRGKTCGLCCRNETISRPSQKPRTVDNMLL